ncbi:hypothetical protein PENSPDRAFT_724833 [Peniophora sp. CONT]|nr:hypothetical protein PENSPDRAFT_724833 [Peniophora sp. CONT]
MPGEGKKGTSCADKEPLPHTRGTTAHAARSLANSVHPVRGLDACQRRARLYYLDALRIAPLSQTAPPTDHAAWQECIARQKHSTFIVNAIQPLRDGGFLDGAAVRAELL